MPGLAGLTCRSNAVVFTAFCSSPVNRARLSVKVSAIRNSVTERPVCVKLSLTLADLGGVGEGIFHALPDMARNFDTISARPGRERNLMRPYFAAHCRNGVAEGEDCFWIPSGGSRF